MDPVSAVPGCAFGTQPRNSPSSFWIFQLMYETIYIYANRERDGEEEREGDREIMRERA